MGTKSVTVPGGLYAWTKQFLTRVGIDVYIISLSLSRQPFIVPWRAEMAPESQ